MLLYAGGNEVISSDLGVEKAGGGGTCMEREGNSPASVAEGSLTCLRTQLGLGALEVI